MLRTSRIHPAWIIAAVTLLTMMGSAGFRAAPGVLMNPLHDEFGWSMGLMGTAVSINLILFGLVAPFSAALMERFGVRPVMVFALVLIGLGSVLPRWMTQPWQLIACWGLLIGLGTGAISMSLVATITGRWFVERRGLVSGVLSAANATGQLAFLPVMAWLSTNQGWRSASTTIGIASWCAVPLVLLFMRNRPEDLGVRAYGAAKDAPPASKPVGNAAKLAVTTLRDALRHRAFWLLAGTFAICGASTNGLVGTHFIPAAIDHGMGEQAAAGLLALVGIFDIIATIASGWLTDRFDPRLMLGLYYFGRGLSLFALPSLFADSVQLNMFAFILFYGLDWVATVPPTMALCRQHFGDRAPIVFGWVFASHQLGAALTASFAGWIRDDRGTYDMAFYIAGALCIMAAAVCPTIVAQRTKLTDCDTEEVHSTVGELQV
ncbi:MFS transporter [Yimella sp. cx-573]|nr:MFS transporter [Yimella sp. cx-573]